MKKYLQILFIILCITILINKQTIQAASNLTSDKLNEFVLTSNIDSVSKVIPIGSVLAFGANALPTMDGSWLECNGQWVNPAQYPQLAAIMSNTPNYQGVFMRGNGNQSVSGVNYASGNLYSPQGDTVRQVDRTKSRAVLNTTHGGGLRIINSGGGAAWVSGYWRHSTSRSSWNYWSTSRVAIDLMNSLSSLPQSNEIRPVNVAVKYYVKAR